MDFAISCRLLDPPKYRDDARCAAANRIEELHGRNARLKGELGYVKGVIRSAKSIVWQEIFPKYSDWETFRRIWMLVRAFEARGDEEMGDGGNEDNGSGGDHGNDGAAGGGGTDRTKAKTYRNDGTDGTEETEDVMIL